MNAFSSTASDCYKENYSNFIKNYLEYWALLKSELDANLDKSNAPTIEEYIKFNTVYLNLQNIVFLTLIDSNPSALNVSNKPISFWGAEFESCAGDGKCEITNEELKKSQKFLELYSEYEKLKLNQINVLSSSNYENIFQYMSKRQFSNKRIMELFEVNQKEFNKKGRDYGCK